MPDLGNTAEPDARTLAELSALADGRLDTARSDALRKRIAGSPELSRRYERERRAVEALRELRADHAPATLRIALDARRPAPRRRVPVIYGGALTAAVAAAVAALVLLLPGGTPGAPSVSQAATVALRGPAMAAPAPDQTHPGFKLNQDVQDVYFPNWLNRFGYRAVGQRVDRIGGHLAVTVYYQREGGSTVAYTILAAPALAWPGTRTESVKNVTYQSFTSGDRLVVTWRRAGHTCILSGSRVSLAELARLAAWEHPGLDRES